MRLPNRPSRNLEQSVSLVLGWRQITSPMLSSRAAVYGKATAEVGSEGHHDKLPALIGRKRAIAVIIELINGWGANLMFSCLDFVGMRDA
jgi:hypothetical protein